MTGIELIEQERNRQIEQNGWSVEHNSKYADNILALAGVCYALPPLIRDNSILKLTGYSMSTPVLWPFAERWWKPCPDNRIHELAKAGALIAAEIDRLINSENSRE